MLPFAATEDSNVHRDLSPHHHHLIVLLFILYTLRECLLSSTKARGCVRRHVSVHAYSRIHLCLGVACKSCLNAPGTVYDSKYPNYCKTIALNSEGSVIRISINLDYQSQESSYSSLFILVI